MSTCASQTMTNHHVGALSEIAQTLRRWGRRARERTELARFSERELHDVGLSWGEMLHEVDKPFWRQ
ncbi:DUF1127 domain-containing protein [Rhodopseudomonas sp. B29]|uniref:DUF1127 domain-containing protein n=1 Tax=Rhodopseudomonas sp. B29 TaxID=95607 RepID=UPI00034A7156|nr:DUF1127 domain-containing protein [Rhodopseudomonas sp. B29]